MKFKVPHPLVLLTGCVILAAVASHVLPAGEYERRDDEATGRSVVVAGTYHEVEPNPVGPFDAVVALPRGMADAAEVIFLVFLIGGAFMVVDRTGALRRGVTSLIRALRGHDLLVIPLVSLLFATGGVVENMQEEIIPLIPVLLILARRLGFTPMVAVAMSAGAAFVGSAFSPINPFQVAIAQKLAELPLASGAVFRIVFLVLALTFWIAMTMRYARRTRGPAETVGEEDAEGMRASDWGIFALVAATFAVVVVGDDGVGVGVQRAVGRVLHHGRDRGAAGPDGRERDGQRVCARVPRDGVRGAPDRVRARNLRGAAGRPHRGHDRARHVHAARGAARAGVGVRDGGGAYGGACAGAECERSGGADDAAIGAALGPAGTVAPGDGAGVSVRGGAVRFAHADERGADGGAGVGGCAV